MPINAIKDPQHWLSRAEELRAVAMLTDDLDARAAMLRVADEYEKLAIRAAERAKAG
jgi:hypothetical protein